MVRIVPYLTVKNGKEAIELYKRIFNAKLVDHEAFSPETTAGFNFPKDFDYENSTMHAELDIGGSAIFLSDNVGPPAESSTRLVEVVLDFETKEEIENIYKKAQENGCEIMMELQQTFWGALYSRFSDPFGIGWQLNHDLPQEESK
ncbi:MAG: VOC family protein [Candidatus Heimdallarchaeota archaeon]